MIYDIQKGSLLKRFSAFLLDAILLVILAAGFSFAISAVMGYNKYNRTYEEGLSRYSAQYGIDFSSVLSQSDFDALSGEEQTNYMNAVNAMNADPGMIRALNVMVMIIVTMISVSLFLSYMVFEFILPLIFKNGQTIGKKIFGLGLMRKNGVRMTAVPLFIRTFLGKYVIETMVPVLVILMMILNAVGITGSIGLPGPILVLAILIAQISMVLATKTNSMIHDLLADCVVVDLASQMIFENEQSMIDYKARIAAENAAGSDY